MEAEIARENWLNKYKRDEDKMDCDVIEELKTMLRQRLDAINLLGEIVATFSAHANIKKLEQTEIGKELAIIAKIWEKKYKQICSNNRTGLL